MTVPALPAAALAVIDLGSLRDVVSDFVGQAGVRESITAVIEVGLLAWFFYVILRFLHGTRGLAVVKGMLMIGLAVIVVLYLVSSALGLSFTRLEVAAAYLLPTLFIGLLILFQPELRRGLSRLSEARGGRAAPSHLADLASGFENMARQRTGALVVFEQKTGISGLYEAGVPLDAALSGAMLESIFYPKSPLHDGAVIVQGNRIVAASVMLPLSDRNDLGRELGTRHRAAVGVTEETDAVAVVVSEESGVVSVAHRGELHPVEDEQELVETFQDLLSHDQPEQRRRGLHPYRWIRRDFGRKASGLLLAVMLWLALQSQLVGEQDQRLDLHVVTTQSEAETRRRAAPGVFLVVPKGFMVRLDRLIDPALNPHLSGERVRLQYKGLKRDITDLELSAVIEIDPDELAGMDEVTVEVPLDARRFRDKVGERPDLIEFDADPDVLRIPVERTARAVFQLGPANVTVDGPPAPGYLFDEQRIRLEPNLVTITGPASRIEELLSDPGRLKLQAVALAGKNLTVSQAVGLDASMAPGITIGTPGGMVNVTVPVVTQPVSVELLLVPVRYRNPEALAAKGLRVVQKTETLDLRLTGPASVLAARPEEWLRERVELEYEWSGVALLQAKEKVTVVTPLDGELAKAGVAVTMMDGRAPEIEYHLEPLVAPGPAPGGGPDAATGAGSQP